MGRPDLRCDCSMNRRPNQGMRLTGCRSQVMAVAVSAHLISIVVAATPRTHVSGCRVYRFDPQNGASNFVGSQIQESVRPFSHVPDPLSELGQ